MLEMRGLRPLEKPEWRREGRWFSPEKMNRQMNCKIQKYTSISNFT